MWHSGARVLIAVGLCAALLARPAAAAATTEQPQEPKAAILAMPVGTNLELRLKDKSKLRGARGAVSDTGFTLVDQKTGERQILFADVAWVKAHRVKSHTGRNILIGVGIGVGAVAILIITLAHVGGYL